MWSRGTLLTEGARPSADFAGPIPSTIGGANATAAMGNLGLGMSIAGAVQSMVGNYYAAKQQKQNLQFQAQMSQINARMAETQAQSILDAGQKQVGQLTLQAGKVKSAARASMAANGIALNEGSAAEIEASTDLMKETDALTISANAVRAAGAARTQSVNASNQGLLQGSTASSISAGSAAMSSLMTGAGQVAAGWYKDRKAAALSSALGLD